MVASRTVVVMGALLSEARRVKIGGLCQAIAAIVSRVDKSAGAEEEMSMARASALSFLWLMAALGAACAQAQTQVPTKVRLGLTRTLIVGATNTAIEKGYFREFGIDVDVNYLDGSANSLFLLAQNELQVVEGGVSA
eukprot:gene46353-59559_t